MLKLTTILWDSETEGQPENTKIPGGQQIGDVLVLIVNNYDLTGSHTTTLLFVGPTREARKLTKAWDAFINGDPHQNQNDPDYDPDAESDKRLGGLNLNTNTTRLLERFAAQLPR
jgi:hypothetical protein